MRVEKAQKDTNAIVNTDYCYWKSTVKRPNIKILYISY